MKKLGKMSLSALRENYLVLNDADMRTILAGDGSGDCLFQSIAFATGQSVDEVQKVYADYLKEKYGWNDTTAHNYTSTMGVSSNDLGWLFNQFGISSSSHLYSNGGYGIMILYGHAVNFDYADASGNFHYYDPQQGTWGYVHQSEVYGVFRYDDKSNGWGNSGYNDSYSYNDGNSYNNGGSYNDGNSYNGSSYNGSYSYNNGGSYNGGYSYNGSYN